MEDQLLSERYPESYPNENTQETNGITIVNY